MNNELLGIYALPELIRQAGIPVVFAMLGGTNAPWLAAGAESSSIEVVRTRHEDTAVNAATAYGRMMGGLGICSVTRGPGFANAVNALLAAKHSHLPVLLIVAESPSSKERTPQDIDQRGLTEAIGAGFHHVAEASALEAGFWRALNVALDTACPQVLSVADVAIESLVRLDDEVDYSEQQADGFTPRRIPPDPESLGPVVDALVESSRPLIIAGQGAVVSGAHDALVELADLAGARLATTLLANHMFSSHPRNLGLSGTWSAPAVLDELMSTDLVLAFGASLDRRTTSDGYIYSGAKVVHCEADMNRPIKATSPDLALLGDARLAAEGLVREWRQRQLSPRSVACLVPGVDEIRASILDIDLGHDPARGLDLRHVYVALDDLLPDDRVVVVDVGRFVRTLPVLISAPDARAWITARGHGSVGLGLGLALGAAVADRRRPVVLFCGDGGLMMMAHDLDAARVNGLNLTIIVLNDEQLGADVNRVRQFGLPPDILQQPLPDIPSLASSLGGRGVIVREIDDFATLNLSYEGLTIVDVRLDPEVNAAAAFG